jgi:HEAT repeat protein
MSYSEHSTVAAYEARQRDDVDFLLRLLASGDQLGRSAAAQSLGDLRSERAVEPLVRCLQATDEGLRVSALKALAKIGDTSVVPQVFEIATGEDSFGVRATAAETLGRLGDRRAASVLGAMFRESDSPSPGSYRKWAVKLLVELGGTEAIPDLEAARTGVGPLGRWRLRRAITALRRLESGRVLQTRS